MYELGGRVLESLSKECNDSLSEGEGSVGFHIFCYIVKLLTMRGESNLSCIHTTKNSVMSRMFLML